MGLFSGSFGTGLASGLATSVDKSMTDAMDKRDKDMSRARSFWETRQAQKQDIAEDETKRAKKSYDRLVTEFGGSTVKALAAYKAIGGSADTVETYLARLDDNRMADRTYNINDMFKFDNIKLEDYADFTREQAYEDIKTSVSAPDITYKEAPSILTTLGFGRDEKAVSKNLTEQVESLLPSSERVDSGIMAADTPVNIFRGMQDDTVEKTFQAGFLRMESELAKLTVGTPEYVKKTAEYESLRSAAKAYTADISRSSGDSSTVNNIDTGYKNQVARLVTGMNYKVLADGTATGTIAGKREEGTEVLAFYNNAIDQIDDYTIRNIIYDETGAMRGGIGGVQDTWARNQGPEFMAKVDRIGAELAEENNTGALPGDPPLPELKKIDPMFLNKDKTKIHERFLDPEASIASIQEGKALSPQGKIKLAESYKLYAVANLQGEELTKYLESIDRLLPQRTADEFATSIAAENKKAKAALAAENKKAEEELAAKEREEMLNSLSPKDRAKFLKEEASGQSAEKQLDKNKNSVYSREALAQSTKNREELDKILDGDEPVSQSLEKRYRDIATFAGGRPKGNPFIVQELLADKDMPIPPKNS